MDSLYRENILDNYKNPRNLGRLKNPDFSHEEENPLCGDRIGMEIKLKVKSEKLKVIEDIRFYGEGCAISTASASMLTEKVKGKTLTEVKKLGRSDIIKMLGICLSPLRLKCALLPLEVLHKSSTVTASTSSQ